MLRYKIKEKDLRNTYGQESVKKKYKQLSCLWEGNLYSAPLVKSGGRPNGLCRLCPVSCQVESRTEERTHNTHTHTHTHTHHEN
jgi:hypothetical protein